MQNETPIRHDAPAFMNGSFKAKYGNAVDTYAFQIGWCFALDTIGGCCETVVTFEVPRGEKGVKSLPVANGQRKGDGTGGGVGAIIDFAVIQLQNRGENESG